jgi:hypothetical protein
VLRDLSLNKLRNSSTCFSRISWRDALESVCQTENGSRQVAGRTAAGIRLSTVTSVKNQLKYAHTLALSRGSNN